MGACIAVMAGGTGGHVFPALAVAERLRDDGDEVFWIGTRQGMEADLVPRYGFEMEWISIEGVRGKGAAQLAKAPFRLAGALWQAAAILRRRRPAVVLGMGGFVAGPGGLMARALGIPLVIHEQNSVPGMTNQWLSRVATRVFEAFPGSFPVARGAVACGNPVRAEIVVLAPPADRLRVHQGRKHLLILGGSLGAKALNETVPRALALIPEGDRPFVRHQAGRRTLADAEAGYRAAGVEAEITPFIDDMAGAYAWADFVICRAGALTVSELAAAGIGSVLVPFPFAVDDHQVGNGRYLSDAGAALLMMQSTLTAEGLAAELVALLSAPVRMLAMAEAARARAQIDAVERIAAACREVRGQ